MLASLALAGLLLIGGAVAPAAAAETTQPERQLALIGTAPTTAIGDDVLIDFRIIGQADDAAIEVVVRDRLTDRAAFHSGLAGLPVGGELYRSERDPAHQFRTTATDYRLTLPTRSIGLTEEGVYEVELLLRGDDDRIEDRLFLHTVIVAPPRAEPASLQVAIVVPLTATAGHQADGTVQIDRTALGRWENIGEGLATTTTPLTLQIRPETIVALGTEAPRDSRARALLQRLQLVAAEREILASPFVDLDVDAWTATGLGSDVADQYGQGIATLAATFERDITPGPWLAPTEVQPDTLTLLAALGFDRVVLEEASVDLGSRDGYQASDGQRFEIVDGNGLGQNAMLADPLIGSHLDRSANQALNANHLLADLSMVAIADRAFARGIVIVLPDEVAINPALLEPVLKGLGDHPLLTAVTLTELFATISPAALASDGPDGPTVQRNLRPTDPPATIGLQALRNEAQNALVSFADVVPNGGAVFDQLRQLLLISADAALGRSEQEDYLRAVIDRVALDANAVSASAPDRVTLSSRSGIVPVTIRNDGDVPVRALLTLTSDKLRFPDGARAEQLLLPGVTELDLEVEALSSGDALLDVRLLSPDRGIELERTRIAVRSTALSGVGLVIAAIALAFLFVWWVRNLRTHKRDKRLVPLGG